MMMPTINEQIVEVKKPLTLIKAVKLMQENKGLKKDLDSYKTRFEQLEKEKVNLSKKNLYKIQDLNDEKALLNKEIGEIKSQNRILKSMQENTDFYKQYIGKRSWLENKEDSAYLDEKTGDESSVKRQRTRSQ